MTTTARTASTFLLLGLVLAANLPASFASIGDGAVRINEVAYRGSSSGDGCPDGADWVELYNTNSDVVDLTGYVLHDNNGIGDDSSHTFSSSNGVAATTIDAGGFLLLCKDDVFQFGIGAADTLTLLDAAGETLSTIALEGRGTSNVTYAMFDRYKYTAKPTPGAPNKFERPVDLDDSDLYVESLFCAGGLSRCADAADCFSHGGDICNADGSMDVDAAPQCGSVQNLCTRCFPYSRCGGGELRIDDSGIFAAGGSCEQGLAGCESVAQCFDHSQGICQKDGSVSSDECGPAQALCQRCYPNSRCGGLYQGPPPKSNESPAEDAAVDGAGQRLAAVAATTTAAVGLWMVAV